MKITTKLVTELIPYVKNSRTHSDEQVAQIAASIKEFGWTNPILVDGDNGIIAGHGRLMAARKLGHTEVPTIELKDLTEAQKKAYIIADNRLALNAGWDNEMLTLEFDSLKELGFDLELTCSGGFTNVTWMPFNGSPSAPVTSCLTVSDQRIWLFVHQIRLVVSPATAF